ncbi:MAG: hypothetical protein QNJ53_02680 [Pleurocapsa sp. MO_192.B19]|nr:hypothetical protein [Pleurocapsa sp. MO_192.B19]
MPIINHKYGKILIIFCGLILCSTSLVKLQQKQLKLKFQTKEKNSYLEQEEHLQTAVNLQKNLPSFDFDNLLADWNYLRFIQYFGDGEAREVTGYSLVTDYFEVVVDKDPRFTQAFLSLSSANSLFAGQPKKTVELIDKVLESASPDLPGYPFFLWTYKATDEILFLGDLEAAKNSYKMAAEWASMRDDDLGNEMANRYLTTVKFLASNPDSTDAQIGAWVNVLNQAQDLKTQQHAIDELEALGVDVSITEEGKIKIKRPDRA